MPNAYLIQVTDWIRRIYFRAKVHFNLAETQRKSDLIAKTIFSIFQISIIIFIGLYIALIANFILSEQEGIMIIPFDTSGMGKDCSGKAVADRLGMEIQKIRATHEYKQMQINLRENKSSVDISGTPLKSPQFIPPIVSTERSMDKSLSEIGNIDVGPASVSIGQLLLTLRSIAGRSDKSITGSLETYGSNITIVALLEDKGSNKGLMTWESTVPIESRNLSEEEMVPYLINDLAYNIFYDIKYDLQATGISKSWISFKHSTEGWNAYRNYNITNDPGYLNRAEEMMRKSLREDPYNLEAAQLLVILQSRYQEIGNRGKLGDLTDIAIQIPVLSGEAWYNKGISAIYYDWREAADAFDNAVKADPENKLYWASKSFALNKLFDDDALAAAEEAIKLDPEYADAWHEKGIALYYLGDYKNSSDAYNLAIKLDQNVWWYYNDYAILLWMMGRTEDCSKCYEEAIKNFDIALKFDLSYEDRTDIIGYKKEILSEAKISGPTNSAEL